MPLCLYWCTLSKHTENYINVIRASVGACHAQHPNVRRVRLVEINVRANKHIRPQAVAACLNCSAALSPHQACASCGFYKGRKVLTTKLERVIKRGESRRAQQTEQAHQATEAEHEHKDEK